MTTSDNMEMGITGYCAVLKLQANIGELELNRATRNYSTGLIIVTPYSYLYTTEQTSWPKGCNVEIVYFDR